MPRLFAIGRCHDTVHMPMTTATLQELHDAGYFSGLDYHFARTMGRLARVEDPLVLLGAAAVSRFTAQGHVCLDLSRLAGRPVVNAVGERIGQGSWPPAEPWRAALCDSPMVARSDISCPLVIDGGGRLYLARYWQYQQRLLFQLRARASELVAGVDRTLLSRDLARLFPPDDGLSPVDCQRRAAEISVLRHLTVVSGGPGTGKTFTVVKMLALIISQSLAAGGPMPRIFLAAPTGKAAARLKAAISDGVDRGDTADFPANAVPSAAATLHRLLGPRPLGGLGGRRSERPLAADVLVVDEASMVDLSLMTRTMEAVPAGARVILLGDKDQLASVEAGAILGDICAQPTVLDDCIVRLNRSFRYDGFSAIAALADAVRNGDAGAALACLRNGATGVSFLEVSDARGLARCLGELFRKHYQPVFEKQDPQEQWRRFNRFRVLCAHRDGPFGVGAVNALAENRLADGNGPDVSGGWYAGRPVMITKNDYQLRLFNGDVGLVVQRPDRPGSLGVLFPDTEGGRFFPPSRLPAHETVYAMTVHKSQGSEFDAVALVLPPKASPVLTRELLYTAVTRARSAVTVIGTEQVLRGAVETPVLRASGLSEQLLP